MRLATAALADCPSTALILAPSVGARRAWETFVGRWYAGPVGELSDDEVRLEAVTVAALDAPLPDVVELAASFDTLIVDDPAVALAGACSPLIESTSARTRLGLARTEPPEGSASKARIEALVGRTVAGSRVERSDDGGERLRVRLDAPLDSIEADAYARAYRAFATATTSLPRVAERFPMGLFDRWAQRSAGRRARTEWESARAIAARATSKRRLVLDVFRAHPTERVIAFTSSVEEARAVAAAADADVLVPRMSRARADAAVRRFREGRRSRLIVSPPVHLALPAANVAIFLAPLADEYDLPGLALRSAWGDPPVVYELAAAHTMEDRRSHTRGQIR